MLNDQENLQDIFKHIFNNSQENQVFNEQFFIKTNFPLKGINHKYFVKT